MSGGPYRIAHNVGLERRIDIHAVAKHGASEQTYQSQCFGPPGQDYAEFDDPYSVGVLVGGAAAIYKAGTADEPLVSVSWAWPIIFGPPVGEGPQSCPDDYEEGGTTVTQDITLKRHVEAAFYGGASWTPTDAEVGVYTQNYYHTSAHAKGLTTNVNFDASIDIVVRASGTFDVYAVNYNRYNFGDYRDWEQDHDVYGRRTTVHEVYYVPTSGITLTVTAGTGTHSVKLTAADFASQAEFEEFFKYGFGMLGVYADLDGALGAIGDVPFDSDQTILSGTFSGAGIGGVSVADDTYYDESTDTRVRINTGTGAFSVTSTCPPTDPMPNPTFELVKGAHTITYEVRGSDFGGNSRVGLVKIREKHDGNPSFMTVGLNNTGTFYSKGHYRLYALDNVDGPPHGKDVLDYYSATNGYAGEREEYEEHTTIGSDSAEVDWWEGMGGLMNLDGLGEPYFPASNPPATSDWFDDARCDIRVHHDNFKWADALAFDIASSISLVNLGEAASWTVEEGAANLTYVDGKLNVAVTDGPCTISRAVDGWLTGARLLDVDYSGDDTNPVEIQLGSDSWEITPDDRIKDILAPKGRAGADNKQLDLANTGGWAAGLNHITSLKLKNLRESKTYRFGTVTGKRIPQADGGFTRVEVCNEAFVGADQAENGGPDPYSGTRALKLIVDGVVAGEAGQGVIGGASWLSPGEHGLISMSFGTSDGEWKDESECEAYDLETGLYTGYASLKIDAHYKASYVRYPVCMTINPSFIIDKQLRGGIDVLMADPAGLPAASNFTLEHRHVTGGPLVSSKGYTTDGSGSSFIAGLSQPLYNLGNIYTVKAKKTDGSWVSTDVETRNRNRTHVCLVGGFTQSAEAPVCVQSPRTGRLYLVYKKGTQIILRIYDYSANAYAFERTVIAESSATGLGIAYVSGRNDEIAIYHDEGGTIKRLASTDEGRTWSSAVSIATGTHPQAAYSPSDMTEMCCYTNASNKICVKRKLGTGTWSAEIEVASVGANDTATLTPLLGGRTGDWVLFLTSGGAIRRYKSLDTGRTWTLDE